MQDPETGRRLARRRMSICSWYSPTSAFIHIPERGSVQDHSAEIREKKWERSVAEDCRKPTEFGPERDSTRKENPAPRRRTRLLIRVPAKTKDRPCLTGFADKWSWQGTHRSFDATQEPEQVMPRYG